MTRAERRERKLRAASRAKNDEYLRLRLPSTMKRALEDVAIDQGKIPAEIMREAFALFLKRKAA